MNKKYEKVKSCYQTEASLNLATNPLSIDLIRKLKRPGQIPKNIVYTNSASFQGTTLEDWLMQTLDEYITSGSQPAQPTSLSSTNTANRPVKDTTPVASFAHSDTATDEIVDEQIVISYQVAAGKSNYSLPGTQEITPANSMTTSVTSINMDEEASPSDDKTNPNRAKLTSDSYKQAVQSSDHLFCKSADLANTTPSLISQMNAKRQEAKFYVQQILTDLIALGVLEYESGFENAINKTFKVGFILSTLSTLL